MKENIIEINSLKKYFGSIKAVDDITFSVKRGSLFAFLGLNGAGKSTTINIICTILSKDSGEVIIDGYNLDKSPNRIKENIGIVFQNSVLDGILTVAENLKVRASYYGLRGDSWKKRLAELTKLLDLSEILKRPYGKLSGGQKRRVDIARGLINRPKLLILDEPTTGLDPQTRKSVWKVINRLKRDYGMTIFLTTHYMEEANTADKVVILDRGKIVANGTPNNLKNLYSGDYLNLYLKKNEKMDKILEKLAYPYKYVNDYYRIKTRNSIDAKNFILANSQIVTDFEVIKGDMDDVFLNATGKELNVGAK